MNTPDPSPENESFNQEIKISHHNTASKSTVHLLPCKVECEGVEGCSSAKVDTYFAPVIRATNETIHLSTAKGCDGKPNQVYTATFRGRRLKGVNIAIPDGLNGVMLRELNQSHGDEEREFVCRGEFSEFTYWNLQSTPTTDDKLIQAMTWNNLAQTLHKPLPFKKDNSIIID